MTYPTSSTESKVDGAIHHPEKNEVHVQSPAGLSPHDAIAERAHELWRQRGCPEGSAEQDWFEAEEQLRGKFISDNTRATAPPSGSVQR
jgi:hypothetical protein